MSWPEVCAPSLEADCLATVKFGPLTERLNYSLAYCELYLTVAAIFAPGRFRFELFETDVTDVEIAHDFFNPCYRFDSKGLRVVVH